MNMKRQAVTQRIKGGIKSLVESNYTPKYYAPKWAVRRENDMLDRIVDGLVEESRIEYVEEIVHIADFSFQLFKAPFAYLEEIPETSPFYQHCRDIYGLTPEEITYVWKEYRNIIRKEMQSNPKSNLISPFNESTEDNFLDKIVNQLVSETIIDYDNKDMDAPFIPPKLKPNLTIPFSFSSSFFSSFLFKYGREVYGLTAEETWYVWQEYEKIIRDKINNKPLNESTEDNFLGKIVNQLVDETHVFNDRGQLRANPPFFQSEWDDVEVEGRITGVVGGMPLAELIASVESKEFDYSLAFMDFKYYCKQMYGLTWEECHEVWDKYREALYNTDFSHLYTPNIHLDESTEGNFLDKTVNQLVDETIIEDDEYGISVAYPSWITDDVDDPLWFGENEVEVDILLDSDQNSNNYTEFYFYVNEMYGLTDEEINYVWQQYKSEVWDKEQNRINDYHRSLEDEDLNESKNESTYKNYLGRILQRLVDETIVEYGNYEEPLSYPPWIVTDNEGVDLGVLLDSGSDHWNFNEFSVYVHDMYGLTEDETKDIWETYLERVYEKFNLYITQNNLNHPWRINESKEDLNDRVHTAVNDALKHKSKLRGQTKIKKYFMDKGMDKWEADQAMVQYLSKINENTILNEQTFADDIDNPIYEKIANTLVKESEIVISPAPYNKMFLRSPAWKEAQHIENVIDQLTGRIKDVVPDLFVKHLKEIYNIKYPTFVQKVWELYRDKILKQIEDGKERLSVTIKQQKFFDHILKTLVNETQVQTMKDWMPDDETYEQKVWVTPPFINHAHYLGVDPYREESVEWTEFSFFGYGYHRYMKDIYGLTDKEGLKLWAPYYKALEKKVEEVIERDRLIYGDD